MARKSWPRDCQVIFLRTLARKTALSASIVAGYPNLTEPCCAAMDFKAFHARQLRHQHFFRHPVLAQAQFGFIVKEHCGFGIKIDNDTSTGVDRFVTFGFYNNALAGRGFEVVICYTAETLAKFNAQ